MTTKKLGRQTVALANPPTLAGHANVVGKKEGEGPLASSFDLIGSDDTFGEATWEKSESAMQKQALALALLVVQVVLFQLFYKGIVYIAAVLLHEAALKGNAVAYDVLYLFRTDFSYLITALGKVAQYALTA